MATPHFTLAICPNCGAVERAVGHWTSEGTAGWYCFNCKATGTMTTTIDTGSTPEDPSPPMGEGGVPG